jgi:hypothetical protein
MRSELIFGALTYVPNRFLLTSLASKATRRFHRPNTRIEDTASRTLQRDGTSDTRGRGPTGCDGNCCVEIAAEID